MKYFFSYEDIGKIIVNKATRKEFIILDDDTTYIYSILLKSVDSDRKFSVNINTYMRDYKEKEF